MKKQLFTALLAFAPLFTFSNQTKNAEFITYLNNVQFAIEKNLQQLSHDEHILEQRFPDYNVSKKVLNELFDHPQFAQQPQLSKIEKLMFGLISYKIQSLENITFIPKNPYSIPTNDFFTWFLWNASKEDEQFFFDLSAQLEIDFNQNPNSNAIYKKENEEFMCHLMKTVAEKHCHKNDTRTLQEKMKTFIGSYESLELSNIIVYTKVLTNLLQDIDNKIQELQKA